jgi:hypothetical protein
MTPERRRNLIRFPVVALVRAPVLLPFYILAKIGTLAESIGQMIAHYLPGLEPEPDKTSPHTNGERSSGN